MRCKVAGVEKVCIENSKNSDSEQERTVKYRDLTFICLGGCLVLFGMLVSHLVVIPAEADSDIQQLQIIDQVVNYEYKCKYYTMRLREVNAATNSIQNSLNQLSEEGWILDETVLHRDNEEWQTIFQIFKRPKNRL